MTFVSCSIRFSQLRIGWGLCNKKEFISADEKFNSILISCMTLNSQSCTDYIGQRPVPRAWILPTLLKNNQESHFHWYGKDREKTPSGVP